jgi:GMP synthase-like glutamine amidotransferase
MKIGVVNFYKRKNSAHLSALCKTLHAMNLDLGLGSVVLKVVDCSENWMDIITKSDISHWIFTGSERYPYDPNAPCIPVELFHVKHKKFMLICYSMESALFEMGYTISTRPSPIREFFLHILEHKKFTQTRNKTSNVNLLTDISMPASLYRNHRVFIPVDGLHQGSREPSNKNKISLLSEYNGEVMTAAYKNAIMVQWHPEKTPDGIVFLKNWLVSK